MTYPDSVAIERIVWLDHHESDNAWDEPGAEREAAKFESIGFVIFENTVMVEMTLALPMNQAGGANLCGRPLRILTCAIVERKVLGLRSHDA